MVDFIFVVSLIAIFVVIIYEVVSYISRKHSNKSPKIITARDIIEMKEKEEHKKWLAFNLGLDDIEDKDPIQAFADMLCNHICKYLYEGK